MIRSPQQPESFPDIASSPLRGNLGKAYDLFGERLQVIVVDLNKALTA